MNWPIAIISFFFPLFLLVVDLVFKGLLIKGGWRTSGADVGLCGIAVILPLILIWIIRGSLTTPGIVISFMASIIFIIIWVLCLVLCRTERRVLFSYSLGTFLFVVCFNYFHLLRYFNLYQTK